MLMRDLIDYFAQPEEQLDFESRQNRFRALRSRQDLFQAFIKYFATKNFYLLIF